MMNVLTVLTSTYLMIRFLKQFFLPWERS